MNDTVIVSKADAIGIYNALDYACAFIKAGRKEMDNTAHEQLLNALAQIRRYTNGDPEEEENKTKNLVFKVDGIPIRVGFDVRAEYEDINGDSLVVVLTHEGVIMDLWDKNEDREPVATSSITFDEQIETMQNEDSSNEEED